MTTPERTIAGRYHTIYIVDESTPVVVSCCRDDVSNELVLVAEWALPDTATRARLNERAAQIKTLDDDVLCPLLAVHDEPNAWIAVCRSLSGNAFGAALRMRGVPFEEGIVRAQINRVLRMLASAETRTPMLHLGVPTDTDIVVQDDGQWLLLPFVLLRTEAARGSAYRAPEISATGSYTGASDVYAVSALAFHASTGSSPVSAEQLANGTPAPAPRALAPHLSEMWESVLIRGMQEKPANRFQHPHEMAAALRMLGVLAAPSTTLAVPAPPPVAAAEPDATVGRMLPGNVAPAPGSQGQAAAAPQNPLRLGCLVALAATLVVVAVMLCVLLLLVMPWSPFRSLYNGNLPFSFNSAATAPTALPSVSKAIVAATPTQIPFRSSSHQPITEANAASLTSTGVITNTTFGPIAWAPDGSKLAVAVGNTVTLHEPDQLSEMMRLSGHVGDITSLSWSPDSKYLASGASDDSLVHVYDTTTGVEAYTLRGHEGWIRNVVFSPDGALLASGSTDLSIRIWSVASRKTVLTLNGHTDLIGGIAWSSDGNELISASRDGTVRRWDLRTGEQETAFQYTTAINTAAGDGSHYWATGLVWSHDGKIIIVGATDGSVTLLNAADGSVIRTLKAHTGWITIRGLALTADDKTLYSAGLDGLLTEWDMATGTKKSQYNEHKLGIFGISLEPNGQRLISTSDQEGKLFVWGLADQKLSALRVGTGIPLEIVYAPKAANTAATAEILAVCGVNGLIKLHTTAGAANNYLSGSMTGTQSFTFFGTDRFALIDSQNGIDLYTPQSSTPESLNGVIGTPLAVASTPDGTLLVVAGSDGAQLWRTDSFGTPTMLNTTLTDITHISFSADNTQMALRSSGRKPGYEIWDLTSRALVFHSDTDVYRVQFLAGTNQIALLTKQNTIEIRARNSGSATVTIAAPTADGFTAITTLPNSAVVAAAAVDGTVLLYTANGNEVAQLPQPDAVTAIAANPTGTELSVGHRDGSITRYAIP